MKEIDAEDSEAPAVRLTELQPLVSLLERAIARRNARNEASALKGNDHSAAASAGN